jgi:hypothetical protein
VARNGFTKRKLLEEKQKDGLEEGNMRSKRAADGEDRNMSERVE